MVLSRRWQWVPIKIPTCNQRKESTSNQPIWSSRHHHSPWGSRWTPAARQPCQIRRGGVVRRRRSRRRRRQCAHLLFPEDNATKSSERAEDEYDSGSYHLVVACWLRWRRRRRRRRVQFIQRLGLSKLQSGKKKMALSPFAFHAKCTLSPFALHAMIVFFSNEDNDNDEVSARKKTSILTHD